MIKGCQVLFPETVFYSDCKIQFITNLDRDNCLCYDTKTKLQDKIRINLQKILEERRKDCEVFGKETYLHNRVRKVDEPAFRACPKLVDKLRGE